MNHKRGRAKNQRAGCLACKPWKVNGAPVRQQLKASELRRIQPDDPQARDPRFGSEFDADDDVFDCEEYLRGGTLHVPLLDAARIT